MLTKFIHSDDPEQTVINLASQYLCEVGNYYQSYLIGGETGASNLLNVWVQNPGIWLSSSASWPPHHPSPEKKITKICTNTACVCAHVCD